MRVLRIVSAASAAGDCACTRCGAGIGIRTGIRCGPGSEWQPGDLYSGPRSDPVRQIRRGGAGGFCHGGAVFLWHRSEAVGERCLSDGLNHADFPSSSPWGTSVGGTYLKASGEKVVSETVWDHTAKNGSGGATGWGTSQTFALPERQRGVKLLPEESSGRAVPDVTCNASPDAGYEVVTDGKTTTVGARRRPAPEAGGFVRITRKQKARRLAGPSVCLRVCGACCSSRRHRTARAWWRGCRAEWRPRLWAVRQWGRASSDSSSERQYWG
jgi:hypothetical protein